MSVTVMVLKIIRFVGKSVITTMVIFLNWLIHFYLNNTTNLRAI